MDVGTVYREPRESRPHRFGHLLAFWLWRLLGTAIRDNHLFSLGVLEFRDRVWSWRWELQASIFQLNQALREIKPSPGPPLAQSEMLNLEGPKQGLLETRSLLTRMGHFDNKLGFLHTLASVLVWAFPEREVNGLGSDFGSLFLVFLLTFLTWAHMNTQCLAPMSLWINPSSHPHVVGPRLWMWLQTWVLPILPLPMHVVSFRTRLSEEMASPLGPWRFLCWGQRLPESEPLCAGAWWWSACEYLGGALLTSPLPGRRGTGQTSKNTTLVFLI